MEMERWVVDISEWDPSPQDFSFALSVLPPLEQSSVTRFGLSFFNLCFIVFGLHENPVKKKTQ